MIVHKAKKYKCTRFQGHLERPPELCQEVLHSSSSKLSIIKIDSHRKTLPTLRTLIFNIPKNFVSLIMIQMEFCSKFSGPGVIRRTYDASEMGRRIPKMEKFHVKLSNSHPVI